MLDMK